MKIRMWIAKDGQGVTYLYDKKPWTDNGGENYYDNGGESIYLGIHCRLNVPLKPKERKRVEVNFTEIINKPNPF